MTRHTVLFLDPLPDEQESAIRSRLDPEHYELVSVAEDSDEARLAAARGADFLISWQAKIDATLLRAAKRLRLVQKYKIEPGGVDFEEAQRRDIPVVEIPLIALQGVAEFTIMVMLALVKNFTRAVEETRQQTWLPDLQPRLTTQTEYAYNWINLTDFGVLYRKSVGLVGLGRIGTEVAKMLRPFQVEILYYKRNRLTEAEEQELSVEYAPFEELLRRSDLVSLHLTFNQDNEKLMGKREFALMKPSAFFVNTSRGRLVDEEALYEVLSSGRLAGAALDVFWMEPLPSDSPLWELDNVIATPHVAGIPNAVAAQAEAEMITANIAEYSE